MLKEVGYARAARQDAVKATAPGLSTLPFPKTTASLHFPARQLNSHTWPMSPTMPSRSGKPGRSVVNDSSSLHPCASSPVGHRGWCGWVVWV